jgi:hypothetical protein
MSKQTATLERWAVEAQGSPYTAPEAWILCLRGRVYGHPSKTDGKNIVTSPIEAPGEEVGTVVTKNTIYNLGEPHPDYVDWCKQNGHHVPTKEEPIKWK